MYRLDEYHRWWEIPSNRLPYIAAQEKSRQQYAKTENLFPHCELQLLSPPVAGMGSFNESQGVVPRKLVKYSSETNSGVRGSHKSNRAFDGLFCLFVALKSSEFAVGYRKRCSLWLTSCPPWKWTNFNFTCKTLLSSPTTRKCGATPHRTAQGEGAGAPSVQRINWGIESGERVRQAANIPPPPPIPWKGQLSTGWGVGVRWGGGGGGGEMISLGNRIPSGVVV